MTSSLHMKLASIALSAILLEISPIQAFSQSASPPPHSLTYCRYDIDVRSMPNAHVRLGHILGVPYVTCPFIAGIRAPAHIYTTDNKSTNCDRNRLGDIPVLRSEKISRDQHWIDVRACFPAMKAPPESRKAPGEVILLQSPASDDPRNMNPIGTLAFRATGLAGLPVSYLSILGTTKIGYACFEMMKGADIDPLNYIRATSTSVPPGTIEKKGMAPNCHAAYTALGLQ